MHADIPKILLNPLRACLYLAILLAVQGASLGSRQSGVNAIISELKTVVSDLATFNATLNSFHGGLNGTLRAVQIQGQAQTLINDINKATATVKITPSLGTTDSVVLVNNVVNLQTPIYSTINNLISHKSAFQNAVLGVGSAGFLVKSDLNNLRIATANLGNAIVQRLVPDIQKLAPLVTGEINFHITRAIQAYSN
ncbi:hypothetical protein EYZ11_011261 [Aspergillus tanneri]|uniref:Uncharacterized protein n=1 Tax=Aspergillus tanneri TaxID=1220188 RepID=A0A4S3J392_9EURO|nr:uncharacterized protein ATNIH1004_008177 [Aspergillus tanneri]KAA8643981.1 hypothetical protein ATNIH1004_008177 [Aspergillus tanneri]THC89286.1 hypothetical protein EYZ11_011261 [Aspergillus tanneri]